ncbi:hypothetical protein HMPREF1556_00449 [Porphyromonas sp. oral taxon 278 str. W7784]|nr:hypothetical protein HMPREF1556_00449 [Porphyromonas sp. oral taxon 278 str. W7784]
MLLQEKGCASSPTLHRKFVCKGTKISNTLISASFYPQEMTLPSARSPQATSSPPHEKPPLPLKERKSK